MIIIASCFLKSRRERIQACILFYLLFSSLLHHFAYCVVSCGRTIITAYNPHECHGYQVHTRHFKWVQCKFRQTYYIPY